MTASAIFTAAHAAARLADAVVAYRTRFTTALRAAWAAAKQTIKTVMTPFEQQMAAARAERAAATNAAAAGAKTVTLFGRAFYADADARANANQVEAEVEARLVAEGRRAYGQSQQKLSAINLSFGEYINGQYWYPVQTAEQLYAGYGQYSASAASVGAAYNSLTAEANEDNA